MAGSINASTNEFDRNWNEKKNSLIENAEHMHTNYFNWQFPGEPGQQVSGHQWFPAY